MSTQQAASIEYEEYVYPANTLLPQTQSCTDTYISMENIQHSVIIHALYVQQLPSIAFVSQYFPRRHQSKPHGRTSQPRSRVHEHGKGRWEQREKGDQQCTVEPAQGFDIFRLHSCYPHNVLEICQVSLQLGQLRV